MNCELKNSLVKFSINEKGKVTELINISTGHNYAGNGPLCRVIYECGQELDTEFDLNNVKPDVSVENEKMLTKYSVENEKVSFVLEIEARLENEKIVFNAKLTNNSDKAVIRELQFGVINCQYKESQPFYWSHRSGDRFPDIKKEVARFHSQYCAQENKAVEMIGDYPHRSSMNFMLFADDSEGLYLGSHDPTMQNTAHIVRKRKEAIDVLFGKYPFVKSGESATIEGFVIAPYSGTWHYAADFYRDWAESSWFKAPAVTENVCSMRGWQRMILRHQYGKILCPYDDLEKAYDDSIAAGIDTLFIFGWHTMGHDADYPNYSYDESQGGFENLKKNIEKVQKKGGKVNLYFNGKLIDVTSDFYKETGHRISVKSISGFELRDFYPFSGDGTSIRTFGNKCFVTGCIACKEWMDELKSFVDIAARLEVNGVFFDQLGLSFNRCWDKSHGHPVPYISNNYDKMMALKELKAYARSKNPQMSLGIEWVCDMCAPFVDYTHSVPLNGNLPSDDPNSKMLSTTFYPEIYRYTFPEAIISDREIRDDTDIERRVNLCLLRGMVSDVEIYRCRATIAETPHYSEYLGKANKIREKYASLLLAGKYRDTVGLENSNPEIEARLFENDEQVAVIMSQSHLSDAETNITVPGCEFAKSDGIGKMEVSGNGEKAKIQLKKNALSVLIFNKK